MQSAGAISAAILLSIPASKGLFHRVLMQSEPFTIPLRDKVNHQQPIKQATVNTRYSQSSFYLVSFGFQLVRHCSRFSSLCFLQDTMPPMAQAFAQKIGCKVTDAACLRSKSPEDVMTAQEYVNKDIFVDLKHLLNLFLPWTVSEL